MKITSHWPDITKHVVALALGWWVLSVLLGLFYAFDSLEASKEANITQAIPEFLLVAVITFLTGSVVLSLPLFIWKLLNKKNELIKE